MPQSNIFRNTAILTSPIQIQQGNSDTVCILIMNNPEDHAHDLHKYTKPMQISMYLSSSLPSIYNQTPATRKICTRLNAYINKINKILAVFFVLNK